MVCIEDQSAYLQQLTQSPLAPLLREVLYEQVGEYSLETHNANDVAVSLIICVKTVNKANAEKIFTQFSKRLINKDTHWIYNNFIVFSIVCAVRKFDFSVDWIKEVIDLTYSKSKPIDKRIKDTFRNILAGNYSSIGDFHQISLVYQLLAKDEEPDNNRINNMFSELWRASFPFADDDFLNVISLKAIEIAFIKKALLTPQEFILMKDFVPQFKKRSEQIGKVLSWLVISLIIIGSLYILWFFNQNSNQYHSISKSISFLLGASGIGVSVFWGWKKGLIKFIVKIVHKLFGYRQDLTLEN